MAQRLLGLGLPPPDHEEPRGARHEGHDGALGDGDDGAEPEHDPPSAVDVGEGVVDEVGQEDADGDAQLVQRDEHAALLGRGDLGDVDALGDGGERDREAEDEAAGQEEPVAGAVLHS